MINPPVAGSSAALVFHEAAAPSTAVAWAAAFAAHSPAAVATLAAAVSFSGTSYWGGGVVALAFLLTTSVHSLESLEAFLGYSVVA